MSEESSSKDLHPEIIKTPGMANLPLLKIEKLKQEDDEEQWISGEELNTDGSSDEHGNTSTNKKRRSKVHIKTKSTAKGAIAKDAKVKRKLYQKQVLVLAPDANSGTLVSASQIRLKTEKSRNTSDGSSKCLEIIDDELEKISWRPKRGSIKLPAMSKEDTELEEKNLTSLKESKEVFLNIMDTLSQLQDSLASNVFKGKSNSLSANDSKGAAMKSSEEIPNFESENHLGSRVLLNAYKEMERLDYLVQAKTQEAKREEEAIKKTIKSGEETAPRLCNQKSTGHKGFNHDKLLPLANAKDQVNKNIPSETKNTNETSAPSNREHRSNTVQPADNDHTGRNKICQKNLNSSDPSLLGQDKNSNVIVNPDKVQENSPSQHFIKRNIKLATEGHRMGSLATITEEERAQLDRLLEDLDQQEQNSIPGLERGDVMFQECGYSMSLEAKGSIEEINSRLKIINEERYSRGDQMCTDSTTNEMHEENEIVSDDKRLWKEADAVINMKRRLNEINKTLRSLYEPSEEVEPVEEARIQQLIDEFRGKPSITSTNINSVDAASSTSVSSETFSNDSADNRNSEGVTGESEDENHTMIPVLSSEKVNEIVEMTKSQIPCFKFKHTEHKSEKQDGDKIP